MCAAWLVFVMYFVKVPFLYCSDLSLIFFKRNRFCVSIFVCFVFLLSKYFLSHFPGTPFFGHCLDLSGMGKPNHCANHYPCIRAQSSQPGGLDIPRRLYDLQQAKPKYSPSDCWSGTSHRTNKSEEEYRLRRVIDTWLPCTIIPVKTWPDRRRGEQLSEWPDCTDAIAPT